MTLSPALSAKIKQLNALFRIDPETHPILPFYNNSVLWEKQRLIAKKLLEAQHPHDVLTILQEPIDYQGQQLTHGELLRKNNNLWWYWLFKGLLILLTAPVSIPALLLWSKLTRNTMAFWDVSNTRLVDDILSHCQHTPPPLTTDPIEDLEETNDMKSNKETDNALRSSPATSRPSYFNAEQSMTDEQSPQEEIHIAFNSHSFFSGLAECGRKRETGIPLIIRYKIGSVSEETNTFSINITWFFKWTNCQKKQSKIELLNRFDLPEAFRPANQTAALVLPAPPAPRFMDMFSFTPKPQPTFIATMNEADVTMGISTKKDLYLKAYTLAETSSERVLVLEHLVNAFDKFGQYQQGHFKRSRSDQDLKIDHYLSHLPQNYKQSCETANHLNTTFNRVVQLIHSNQLDSAWELYQSIDQPLSCFIERAFPNLNAMYHQLAAIFIITDHKQYNGEFVIAECEAFGYIQDKFQGICGLVNAYSESQKEFIDNQVCKPLASIKTLGQEGAKNMPKEVADHIYNAAMAAGLYRLAHGGGGKTYRSNVEDDSIDDEPRVEQLDDDNETPSLRTTL